jgi:secondary thiamine-phosphate synthase enzyme
LARLVVSGVAAGRRAVASVEQCVSFLGLIPVIAKEEGSTMESAEYEISTGDELVTDLSDRLANFCRGRGDGLAHVFVPHATAGLALMETGAGSEEDLAEVVNRLFPLEAKYRHRHGSVGHGRDHVLPCFISPSISVPVESGVPLLGTWQSLVLIDSNSDNSRRKVRFSFLTG